ncbi:hypothetical protein [Bradyrhizobium sp. RT4b]|uniref:hypothetical protein n=1 Tax=Bradyrhizobium sp. RT4b TaxID=3156379 RepID=UPI003391A08A
MNRLKIALLPAATALFIAGFVSPSAAGGLLAGVFVRPFSPKAAGDLDNANRQLKNSVPIYKQADETISSTVRNAPERVYEGVTKPDVFTGK